MATVTMKELLEAGVHFGHQVRRWNPKMKEYIFGERNGIYIIDLQKTQKLFRDALSYVQDSLTENPNKKILFVGTKRQAQDSIKEEAERCGQFYVNNRWLGGLLTNFQTVQKSIKKIVDIERMREDGSYEKLTKKERLQLDRQHENLMKNLAGIRDMRGLPDMLFVIDVRKEDIAVKEANRLGIPVVAVVDTNCSPEGVNYVIPGNDDALRAVRLFASRIADAILEGRQIATEGSVAATTGEDVAGGDEDTLEPEINIADKTWETAEKTHPETLETNAEGKRKPEVAGADNKVEVNAEVEVPVSEDVREVINSVEETNAAGNIDEDQQAKETSGESNEAAAS